MQRTLRQSVKAPNPAVLSWASGRTLTLTLTRMPTLTYTLTLALTLILTPQAPYPT